MLVALLSDIHDHTTNLLLALHTAQEQGCSHLLFLGDMAEASTFRTLRDEWPHPIDLVFGNNEYEIKSFGFPPHLLLPPALASYAGRILRAIRCRFLRAYAYTGSPVCRRHAAGQSR